MSEGNKVDNVFSPVQKVVHVDMDCFFAAIEVRDQPHLKGKPIAVGGRERGVISTASYEARKFGVGSAMPVAKAKRLCPDLIILPHSHGKYYKEAKKIRKIFYEYTNTVQAVSVDEAYLEVSNCKKSELIYANDIAKHIRQQIFSETGLTASAGIAPNKLVAKIASEVNKPNGQMCVPPSKVLDFMIPLSLKKIPGIGKVGFERISRKLKAQSCGDLLRYSEEELLLQLGSFGSELYYLCRGIDNRGVKDRKAKRKSLSLEHTYFTDLNSHIQCQAKITRMYEELFRRYSRSRRKTKVKTFFIKLKFSDFQQRSLEKSILQFPTAGNFRRLLSELYFREQKPVRLLGLGVRFAEESQSKQMQLAL